jgi:hypothetical protein
MRRCGGLLLLGLAMLAGCTRAVVRPVPVGLAHLDGTRTVRAVVQGDTAYTLRLRKARIERDSLVGMTGALSDGRRIAIPLTEVRAIAVREFNAADTAVLILGLGAAWVFFGPTLYIVHCTFSGPCT